MSTDRSSAPADSLLGRVIASKYRIDARVGAGSMGVVYRATQTALDKTIALKVLHGEVARDEDFVERFKREALAASLLDHPSSVRVLDFGEEPDGLLYLAMEYVPGRDLQTVIADEWPLDDRRTAIILSQVLAALAVAHNRGVIHRDLKPENILLLEGTSDDGEPIDIVKVCDFGIATLANAPETGRKLTAHGLVVGTPAYMSPEQARGDKLDLRSDLYSVGVVLYEMLAHRAPFIGETPFEVAVKHVTEEVVPPSHHERVDPALESICLRAMAKNPADRWGSAREMRAALRRAVEARGSLIPALPTGPHSTLQQPARKSVPPRFEETPTPHAFAGVQSAEVEVAVASPPRWGKRLFATAIAAGALAFAANRVSSQSATSSVDPLPLESSLAPPALAAAEPGHTGSAAFLAPAVAAPAPIAMQPKVKATVVKSGADAKTVVEQPKVAEPVAAPTAEPVVAAPPSAPVVAAPPPAPVVVEPAPVAKSETVVAVAAAAPPVEKKPFDASASSVSLGAISTTNGVAANAVRSALSHATFGRCYRDALTAKGAPASGVATLHLAIDAEGRVTGASLAGASFLPAVKTCIESAARSVSVKGVDTGEATATATLDFRAP